MLKPILTFSMALLLVACVAPQVKQIPSQVRDLKKVNFFAEEANLARAEKEQEDAIIKAVVDNANVEIPSVMVEKEIDNMVKNLEQRLQYQGLSLEQYFQFTGTDEAKMRDYMKENAEVKVKTDLVLEAVEKAENIEVTEEELKEKAQEVAKMYSAENDDKMIELLIWIHKLLM